MLRHEEPFVPPIEYWQEIAALDRSLHHQDPDPYRHGSFYRDRHAEGVWLPIGEAIHVNPLERMAPHASWESDRTPGKIVGTLTVGRLVEHNGEVELDPEPSLFDFKVTSYRSEPGNLLVKPMPPDIEPAVFETNYRYRISLYALGSSSLEVWYDARIPDEMSGKLEKPAIDEDGLGTTRDFERSIGFRRLRDEQYMEFLDELRNGASGAMRQTDRLWAETKGNADVEDVWDEENKGKSALSEKLSPQSEQEE